MKLRGLGVATVAAALLSTFAGGAIAQTCEYWNFRTDEMLRGKCTSTWNSATEVETWKVKGKPITIKVLDRQGVWARILLNGKPGTRYEHDRTSFSASTDDLKETFGY